VTKWAFVCRGVSISLGQFAVVELSVHEFEEGNALLGKGVKPFVNGMSYCMQASTPLFVGDDESSIQGGVVKAAEKRMSHFES